MPYTMKPLLAAAVFALASPVAFAVNIVGVHDLAVKNDPQLQAAAYRRDEAGENTRQAKGAFLPTLSGSASKTRGTSTTDIGNTRVSDSSVDNESWRLDLSQTVYDQSTYERLDVARGQVSQAEAVYQKAYQDFLIRVAKAYFNVLSANDGVVFAEAEERALKRQFEQAQQRFEVGLTAVTDVHEARASYDNARARAIVQRNQLEDSREALRELTGQYFTDLEPLKDELPLNPPDPNNAEEWVKIALANNPSVQAARYAKDIADANAKLQRSGHFPKLSFNASYSNFTNNNFVLVDDLQNPIGTTALTQGNTSYGLQLSVPIYQGGVVSSRSRQARFELNATQQDLELQQRVAMRQTRDAYRAVLAGIEQVQAFGQALISAKSALDATQAGFEVGTRTIVDVLIAEQRFFQAQRDNSTARHNYILDHLQLKAASGVLAEDDLKRVNEILK